MKPIPLIVNASGDIEVLSVGRDTQAHRLERNQMATMTTAPVCTDFTKFAGPVQARFKEMSKDELYVTEVGDDLFDKYLAAFPAGTNPMFRNRTEHDCVTCRQFVRRLGKLVNIKDGKVTTVWGGLNLPEPYKAVAEALDAIVSAAPVLTVFRTKERKYGETHNYDPKTNERYDHFHGAVADRHHATDPEAKRGERDTIFQVLYRGLTEIKLVDVETVLDLIASNGLYRGEEHKPALIGFRDLLKKYLLVAMFGNEKANKVFVWENLDNRNARFRNTVIGTLLTDLAEGKDLDLAVKAFESKVAPANYKRPTSVITQKMVEGAVQTLTDLGLHGAIARRYAKLSDVSVNDVLFVDNDARGKMKDGITALLESSVKKATPDLKHATLVNADEFIRDVLPGAKTLEAFVENRHQGNFLSLTGADGPERLFRWSNNFAWSYDGDVTDSVKQRVKAAGGNVAAKLRVSLSWYNFDDLDLHAHTPKGSHVAFNNKMGILDVDMNAGGAQSRNAVENLAFNNLEDGVYRIYVNQYRRRETIDIGFAIEVEFGGQVHQHSYPKSLKDGENVECFKLHVKKGELVKIETELAGGNMSQDKWGVKTETLVPVVAAMYSPNHWGDNQVGAKHLILALKDCKNPGSTRGVYNEFLRPDLEKHRKVFEVLGAKTKCPASDEQLSGVGFTAARGDYVTVVVDGRRAFTMMF